MSWLTVFMRSHGLGGVLDTVEAGETLAANHAPEATTQAVETAVAAVKQSIPGVASTAIADLGAIAGQVVDGAVKKAAPGLANLAVEVTAPLLAELEAVATKWVAGAMGGGQAS